MFALKRCARLDMLGDAIHRWVDIEAIRRVDWLFTDLGVQVGWKNEPELRTNLYSLVMHAGQEIPGVRPYAVGV